MTGKRRAWWRSLRIQLSAALVLLFGLGAGAIAYTLYAVDLRKHDYVILNLAGQLRVIAQSLVKESLHFQEIEPGADEIRFFARNLDSRLREYDQIISAYQDRRLPAELTGYDAPLYCSWDRQSLNQLDATSGHWTRFREGLRERIGTSPDAAAYREAARYITANEVKLMAISGDLAAAFQRMMEGKLHGIVQTNRAVLGLGAALVVVLLLLLYFTFVRPLRATVAGIRELEKGGFGRQVPVGVGNEIGEIGAGFNRLSRRMQALFHLTDRVGQATTLDSALQFVFDEFRHLLPLGWVGMLSVSGDGRRFILERFYSEGESAMQPGDEFAVSGTPAARALEQGAPVHVADLAAAEAAVTGGGFAARLAADGYRSALFVPVANERQWATVLVFAVEPAGAYHQDHIDLLTNIAGQLAHAFQKTVVTDSLIVSAVSGLAKLAENRDPETGDHLVRMSLYAALIAEELGNDGPYRGRIEPAYVRDIHRFAPMHDIGKVGIEDRILLKPGRLDADEREQMQRHPVIGAEVLRRCEEQMNQVGHSVFRIGIEIAEAHHEKYDGSGYPAGLAGDHIPLSARIVALADVFDALTSKRPYKDAWPVERALALVAEEKGKHFDPDVVEAMERVLPRILAVYERLKHV